MGCSMTKSLVFASILALVVLGGGCSAGTANSTTSTTIPAVTSTALETTSTTATTLPAGVFETIRQQETESRLTYAGTWTASDNSSAS